MEGFESGSGNGETDPEMSSLVSEKQPRTFRIPLTGGIPLLQWSSRNSNVDDIADVAGDANGRRRRRRMARQKSDSDYDQQFLKKN